MTILEAGAALRARKISSVELTSESLARIAAQSKLNAFITVLEELARKRAAEMDAELARGVDRGPLHGIPFAHKDIIQTRGVLTTAGSKIFADFVPAEDAEVAVRLSDAGAVLVGKTGLHELAYGITSNNPHYGAIRNPWDPERIPGGSSGGSGAAIAAGMVPFATGTDTGGSIRIPSSFCGIVGLKPTYERVSRRGVLPLSLTFDHVGPMAGTVRDVGVVFNAMIGARAQIPEPRLEGIRIGVPLNFYNENVDLEVAGAVRRAIQTAAAHGARIVEVRVPDMEALNVVGRMIQLPEAAAVYRPYLDRRSDFGADVLALLDQGRLISAADSIDAQRLRRVFAEEFGKLWDQVDCLFTPATPLVAPLIAESDNVRLAATRLVRGLNLLGLPALAMPCGFTKGGLPIGLQIVTPALQEERLLSIAAAMEDASGS